MDASPSEWIDFVLGGGQGAMPAAAVQERFVGSSGRPALEEATAFVDRLIAEAGTDPAQWRVLDFGCGWGRISRVLLRVCTAENLVGADVLPQSVAMCREAMALAVFRETAADRPLPFGDASFDVVTAYSVFSHLDESTFRRHFDDFHRLLPKGGLVAFTTLKPAHFACWVLEEKGEKYMRVHLERARFSAGLWARRLEGGEILFVPTGGGDEVLKSSFYGQTIIPRTYLERMAGFRLVAYHDDARLPQAFVLLRRD